MSKALNSHLDLVDEPGTDLDLDLLDGEQLTIAAVAEVYHTASLMHDDVIDRALTRRGRESMNALYGQRRAILSGDYSVTLASKLMAELGHEDVRANAELLNNVGYILYVSGDLGHVADPALSHFGRVSADDPVRAE